MGAWRVDETDAREQFARMDTDRDGLISLDEFGRAAEEFFTSNGEGAVGNSLWGRL